MITDPILYRRLEALDQDESLRRMTPAESIAIGEALLTSELMTLAEFSDDDHPQSLAIALGIVGRVPRSVRNGSERV